MKKKSVHYDNEISIIEIFKTIFDAKISIIFILLISILIGSYYNSQNSNSFQFLLNINSSKDTEFTRFLPMYILVYDDLLNPDENEIDNSNKKVAAKPNEISEIMLERFVKEVLDYEELISILSNNKRIKKSISGLSLEKQNEALYEYAKSLSLYQPNLKDPSKYKLNFIWDDIDEGKNILNDLLKLVSKNLENRIFKELNDLLEVKRTTKLNDDLVRIEYLTEQSLIAQELGIRNNKEDTLKLSDANVSFNINIQNIAYYLRGYDMINKEIDLIKSRKYIQIDNMKNDINLLKKAKVNWTDYNINYINVGNTGNPRLVLMLSIGAGFIVAIIYAFILNMFKNTKVIRKK
tara:strand:- start:3560 stop:4609 length:1050 start_codon:yes stop_codon:yes gene_type:complete